MMGQFCPAVTRVVKSSLTHFPACLKVPHHPPSPPSFFWIVEPLRFNPGRCLGNA